MARRAKVDSSRGRGALFAFVFPVFVPMLPFTVLVVIRGMLVFFVLTTMLVFFPLVFTTAAVMFGPLFCLLTIIDCLLLGRDTTNQLDNSTGSKIISILIFLVVMNRIKIFNLWIYSTSRVNRKKKDI